MAKEKKWWRDFGVGQKTLKLLSEQVGQEFIIFDTETTGLSPALDKIIQISAIKCQIDEDFQFHENSRFNTYINPGYNLPKKIVQLTGITDEQLAESPDEKAQWNNIYPFFGDAPIICGHNVSFDFSMLNAMYARNNKSFDATMMDTLRMAQELHLKEEAGSHKLGVLTEFFGLNYGLTFHNSMDDVVATMRLLRLFIEEYQEKQKLVESQPQKIKTKVKNCWAWTGYRGMQRLYVKVYHEDRVIWMNQRRPYNWGEKDAGSIDLLDMKDIERQVLTLYGCHSLSELSKVRESKYAYRF